jgi:outer membrane protein OmpA-like peptidoglycan-associated protein
MLRMFVLTVGLAACGVEIEGDDFPGDDAPGRVVVTDTEIEILEPIQFAPGSGILDPTRTVEAVASTLLGGGITQMSIIGHADANEPGGVVLAVARAQAVVDALIAQGVPADALSAEPGDESNRGIDFLIVKWASDE